MAEAKESKESGSAKKQRGSQQVPAGFLKDAMKALGMKPPDLGRALGFSTANTVYKYLRTGKCPQTVMLAVNGLMAEQREGGVAVVRVPLYQLPNLQGIVKALGGSILYVQKE